MFIVLFGASRCQLHFTKSMVYGTKRKEFTNILKTSGSNSRAVEGGASEPALLIKMSILSTPRPHLA